MKAFKVSAPEDLESAEPYLEVADMLLFDAKTPKEMTNALPGGNAVSFDWTILSGRDWALPWMLSGGLDADNVAEAIGISGAPAVDVSSGVEKSPGTKDPGLIAEFLASVRVAG
jgi:phosphoribosylanthranilate isomerase